MDDEKRLLSESARKAREEAMAHFERAEASSRNASAHEALAERRYEKAFKAAKRALNYEAEEIRARGLTYAKAARKLLAVRLDA